MALCESMINVKKGIEIPVVGKNGKWNETIEVSALWSITLEPHVLSGQARLR